MRELRAIGATNALAGRRHTLTGKSRFAAAVAAYEHERRDGRLPATWEVIYAHAWAPQPGAPRSEEHTSELQSLMRISYAVFCLKKKKNNISTNTNTKTT